MREIKFRGKWVETGEWVYGYYVNCRYKHKLETGHFVIKYPGKQYEIYTETLGQFTGLKDKYGREIYEGDVLQMFRHSDNTHRHEKDFVSKVSFEFGTFYVVGRYGTKQSFLHMARPGQSFEIIGNIHDNPELIHDQKAEV